MSIFVLFFRVLLLSLLMEFIPQSIDLRFFFNVQLLFLFKQKQDLIELLRIFATLMPSDFLLPEQLFTFMFLLFNMVDLFRQFMICVIELFTFRSLVLEIKSQFLAILAVFYFGLLFMELFFEVVNCFFQMFYCLQVFQALAFELT